jgi:hypothetical protein
MDSSAPSGHLVLANQETSVTCLKRQQIFVGTIKFLGVRGQYKVTCRGMALHLRANSCDGPCRRHYLLLHLPLNEFSSSIHSAKVLFHTITSCSTQPVAAISHSSPPSASHPDQDDGGFPDPDSQSCTPSGANPYPPRPLMALPKCSVPNHQQLDSFFSHQMLVPYIPSKLIVRGVLIVPSFHHSFISSIRSVQKQSPIVVELLKT